MGELKCLFESKPTIKLMKLFAMAEKYRDEFTEYLICCGIWMTNSVFLDNGNRVYELVCVCPFGDKVKIGDTRRMYENSIIGLCEEIQIVRKQIEPVNELKKAL